jgi:hypothetical protein
MKKFISIIFLSILVLKTEGYFAFLTIQQIIFKEEAKEKIIGLLPKDKLVKLSFLKIDINNLEWEEEGKEFYFEGKLYDVVSTETDEVTYTFYCFPDEKETVVYDEILKLSKSHQDELPQKNSMASFLNLLLLKYTLPQIFQFEHKSIVEKSLFIKYFHLPIIYSSILTSPFIPPPNK